MNDKDKCFIIAEIGVNHNGNIEIAKQMIDEAVKAGVDAVKFQSFKSEKLVTKDAPKANYQMKNTGGGSQFDMLKKLELTLENHIELKKYCDQKNILFMSTPFDFESVDLLEKIGVDVYKVSSGELTNIPLLKYIAKLGKKMIVSTGMANLEEVEAAINAIKSCGNDDIILLQCTSNYPTNYEDVNLNSMITMKELFDLPVGYSDHTIGIEVSIAAVSMGAKVIEKHFTLDKNMDGPDHIASLDTSELKLLVKCIRNVEKSLGSKIKKCNASEENTKLVVRKSIVAKENIKKGEEIGYSNIDFKRPGNGISPADIEMVLGKKAIFNIEKDKIITFNDLE